MTSNATHIIPFIDLTSLNESDNESSAIRLCQKAQTPFGQVAAVCIYPQFVAVVKHELQSTNIRIATVANFPDGKDELKNILHQIEMSIKHGANEIDMVFPYTLYLAGKQKKALEVVNSARKLCISGIKLKVIIETGELPNQETIRTICKELIALKIDFIKTSTGKKKQGATIDAAATILSCIKEERNHSVGIKVAGGISTIPDAFSYIHLAQKIMGDHWITPDVFRIGASRLLEELIF